MDKKNPEWHVVHESKEQSNGMESSLLHHSTIIMAQKRFPMPLLPLVPLLCRLPLLPFPTCTIPSALSPTGHVTQERRQTRAPHVTTHAFIGWFDLRLVAQETTQILLEQRRQVFKEATAALHDFQTIQVIHTSKDAKRVSLATIKPRLLLAATTVPSLGSRSCEFDLPPCSCARVRGCLGSSCPWDGHMLGHGLEHHWIPGRWIANVTHAQPHPTCIHPLHGEDEQAIGGAGSGCRAPPRLTAPHSVPCPPHRLASCNSASCGNVLPMVIPQPLVHR